MDSENTFKRIAFVGNYLPRQCGIATFTTDLCESIAAAFPETSCLAVAMNDRPEGYDYPPRVRFEIRDQELDSYRQAADFLNLNNVDIVCVQHEYGIFGGPAGAHLISLLRDLGMPVVTTLHTVIREPTADQRRILRQVAALSDRLVVMAEKGVEFLRAVYGVPAEKIDLIPHGIPDAVPADAATFKKRLGLGGKKMILTFGLLSPNKGIDHAIRALPAIIEKVPETVYVILGATHPNLVAHEGETYRLSLQRLAKELGVEEHCIFYDRFVSLEELQGFIGATDVYLTPYLNEAQITSGTLAYVFGAGKPVVSTPYWHAAELLDHNRGVLVPFGDSRAIAAELASLLSDESRRREMSERAYRIGRDMVWPRVAERYMESFAKARLGRTEGPPKTLGVRPLSAQPYQLPPLKLDHLERMTDRSGILQHALFTVPDFGHGYCTDDNARAYILSAMLSESGQKEDREQLARLATVYLAFLAHAFNPGTGRFRNFMSFERNWLEEIGSEDSHARALWALGTALGRSGIDGHRLLAGNLWDGALPAVQEFTSPRAWAFTILGIHEYLRRFSGDSAANRMRQVLTDRLVEIYRRTATDDWPWFEEIVAYDNAKLSHALILSGYFTSRHDVFEIGLNSLRWLSELQRGPSGCFSPIGSNGFYRLGGERARYDQQPLEAHAMVSACLEAYRLTRDRFWWREATRAFEWFLGRNDLGMPVYDATTGGCRDGLHPDRVNQNQGAESSLCFYLSLAEIRLAQSEREDTPAPEPHPPLSADAVAGFSRMEAAAG